MPRYLVNSNTHEIHDKRSTEQCNVDDARQADHIREVGAKEMVMLLREGFGTCGHCFVDDEDGN